MIVWYHSIGKGPPFPLIPKLKKKSANVWRHNDVIKHGWPRNADFQGNIGQNWIFRQKIPNIGISPGFLLITEGVVFLICSVSFRTIPWRFFFSKWRLKIFWGGNHPLPSDFEGLPYHHLRGYPRNFFHQNDRKWYKRNYLDAQDCFVLRFGATAKKNLLGGGNHPP